MESNKFLHEFQSKEWSSGGYHSNLMQEGSADIKYTL